MACSFSGICRNFNDPEALPENGNIVGENYTVRVEDEEDTLLDIAHAHGIGYEEIRRANPDVSFWVPGKGTTG